jgi:hypothetical protein
MGSHVREWGQRRGQRFDAMAPRDDVALFSGPFSYPNTEIV